MTDSNQRERIQEAAKNCRNVPELGFSANKKDLPNAMTISVMTDKLGLQFLHSITSLFIPELYNELVCMRDMIG